MTWPASHCDAGVHLAAFYRGDGDEIVCVGCGLVIEQPSAAQPEPIAIVRAIAGGGQRRR